MIEPTAQQRGLRPQIGTGSGHAQEHVSVKLFRCAKLFCGQSLHRRVNEATQTDLEMARLSCLALLPNCINDADWFPVADSRNNASIVLALRA